MKKILFMTNTLYGGGAEKVLQTILNHLDSSKYEVILYSMHREVIDPSVYTGKFQYKVVFDTYKGNSKLKKRLFSLLGKVKGTIFNKCSSRLFYRLFIHEQCDVEVAFIEGESTKIISGSTNPNSKKLAWVHIDLVENPWTSFLYKSDKDEKNHYDKFDRILCVSESVREAFLSKFNIEQSKVQVQYNPVNKEEILTKSQEMGEWCRGNTFRMVTVGRLVKQKGFDRLLNVVARLRDDGFKFELLILGEGNERANLETMITSLGLEEMVYLLGFQRNPYAIMAVSDLLVCSSRAEGFSTVLTEGVVLGLPIVSTDCAGVNELFGSYSCGIVTLNDEDALYKGLYAVLSHPESLKEYHTDAVKRGDDFSLDMSMKQLEGLFDE